MKPLLHRSFRTKAELEALRDWTSASAHHTPQGRAEFEARMRERIASVQGIKAQAKGPVHVVLEIKRAKP